LQHTLRTEQQGKYNKHEFALNYVVQVSFRGTCLEAFALQSKNIFKQNATRITMMRMDVEKFIIR